MNVAFDENLINHSLLGLFLSENVYSVREAMISLIPEYLRDTILLTEGILTNTFTTYVMPEIREEFPLNTHLDLRCNFNKNYLENILHNVEPCKVNFREDSRIEYDFAFSCGFFVSEEVALMPDPEKFTAWHQVFLSAEGFHKLGFNAFDSLGRLGVKLLDSKNEIREIKVIQGRTEVSEEETGRWKQKINKMFNIPIFDYLPGFQSEKFAALGSVPLFNYPRLTKCVGLNPENPEVEILEGYMQVGYDFDIRPADENCLWEVPQKPKKGFKWRMPKWPLGN